MSSAVKHPFYRGALLRSESFPIKTATYLVTLDSDDPELSLVEALENLHYNGDIRGFELFEVQAS